MPVAVAAGVAEAAAAVGLAGEAGVSAAAVVLARSGNQAAPGAPAAAVQ